MLIEFPQIDPVALAIGPIQIRWYALAYIAGILLGWICIKRVVKLYPDAQRPTKDQIDDFMTWAILGIILGGRLGYILFYNFAQYLSDPVKIFYVWEGGMAFHGGFLGVVIATILFSLKNKLNMFRLGDVLACVAPIGLFFGRVANFINGELFGRVTDAPWGVVFPHAGPEPRHPSQLYEAGLEGFVLFVVMMVCVRSKYLRARAGMLSVIFILGYAISRVIVELFRQPDAHIGFVFGDVTMGQILSAGMIVGAVILFVVSMKAYKKTDESS